MKKISQGGNLDVYVLEVGDHITENSFIEQDKAIKKKRKKTSDIAITKKQFENTLERVFISPNPDKQQEYDQEANQTSESRLSDDYNGKCKNQDRTVDKEG